MISMRVKVGILFVALASGRFTLVHAQDFHSSQTANDRQADSLVYGGFAAIAHDAKYADPVRDDRLQRAPNMLASISDTSVPAPAQEQSPGTSTATTTQECLDECCDFTGVDACPCYYVLVDALYLQRVPRLSNQPIVVNDATDTTVLSASDLNNNFNPGLQVRAGAYLFGTHYLEFDYFGLFNGNASAATVVSDPTSTLILGDNLAGNVFFDMDRVQVDYSSRIHSFAMNLVCCCGCCEECCSCESHCQSLSWFAGFRYINVNDQLNILAQRDEVGGVEDGSYNIRTTNNLYGGQLGARLRRTHGQFGWDASGFGGIFGNDAQQTQSVTDFPNVALRPTVSSSQGGVAFVGGANLSALYLLTDHWNLRAGYNIIWIDGLALAPNQLDFNFAAAQGGSQIHDGGGLFLHGVNLGLEGRW